jgi:peptide deformylase
MLDIYKLGDDVLRTPTEKITKFDNAIAMLADAMFTTMEEADGVGLAGPQVGVSKRIFVVDTRNEGERYCFINPEIIETSMEMGPYEEGCLSVPGIYRDVVRPLGVTVQAQDINGKSFTIKATGLLARVIQHENDHLYGKLFIDRLDEKEKEAAVKAYEKHKGKGRKKNRV